ncbi:ATP-dependent protease La [Chloroherpeton thalassium ATCC 35110]|uniref:Lon protease n=1 Tax=Chloroherpeton thalassium (strain ATCC 35110 / GB-78) TaxID=517418 RepID=LON_CHLT3|nr:endopeptidase La [Chloroherpeton thalassium]B3QSJ7.1 RecName: Full=Lon protease; AltName: Full=ATP-dependent protease La [Chloroherpeton thalassium ATCC 35110]ACF14044.1 ATP-dependent protease La [Chloroherpeton thalassium ATCC 35110]
MTDHTKEHENTPSMGFLDGLVNSISQQPKAIEEEIKFDGALPVLPLRNTVLFPDVIVPIGVARQRSIALLESLAPNSPVVFLMQTDADIDAPTPDELHKNGSVGLVLRTLRMPDNSMSVIVQGVKRVVVEAFTQTEPYLAAKVTPKDEEELEGVEFDAYARTTKQLASKIIELSPNSPNEASYAIQSIENTRFLIHFIASNISVPAAEKQKMIEAEGMKARAERLIHFLNREVQVLELSKQIQTKVKTDMDRSQREFILRQQLKTIQQELGEQDAQMQDVEKLREAVEKKNLPEEVTSVVSKEIDKLSRIPQASPDYSVTRNYVDTILALPWGHFSETVINLHEAEKILNQDHYGLGKVKDRILEYLAVLKLKSNMKAPILCFCGPPGVGKTSLGRSIARALGRKFIRISLGGVRDEAEIRGHRRTYIGSMPGRIIQGIKTAGTSNPVFMLDEIDKIGADFRGNPSSALLEVLDPAQNNAFSDHYLEIPYDLSKVMFIATANTLDPIPVPLRDRMEIINLSGYTEYEKLHIAERYLIPRQLEEHGIRPEDVSFDALTTKKIINAYTREAGVRNLERQIANVCRVIAKDIVIRRESDQPDETPITVVTADLKKYLGMEQFYPDVSEPVMLSGVAVGLAWTPVGGDILFIESTVMKGTGRLILTGQLGDVMKESAQAALSYLKSCADYFKIPDEAFRYWDVHVHVPQGAIPKDGPSAGVTILTSLASIYTQRKVKPCIAMTGEITLRGRILPVGGIKEKVLAAKRAGITEILLPEKNEKDVKEALETNGGAFSDVSFKYFHEMDDLIDYVLEPAENGAPQFKVEDKDHTPETTGNESE